MNLQTTHLSDDSLDGLLLGTATQAEQAHAASCSTCTARLVEFRSTMATFNRASTAWSEARSNTISRELAPPKTSFRPSAGWSVGTAAALGLALAVSTSVHRDSPRTATPALAGMPADPQEEIAGDNAMLAAIDSELSRPVRLPVEADRDTSSSSHGAGSGEVSN